MQRKLVLTVVVLLVALGGAMGQTALASSMQVKHKSFNKMTRQEKIVTLKKQIHKDKSVLRFWKNHRELRRAHRYIYHVETHWAKVSLPIATRNLHKLTYSSYGYSTNARHGSYMWVRSWLLSHGHGCLVQIIDLEDRTYDPTISYGGGHGNTSVAYGLPQADPGTKMASAGRDWATNPMTQIRWMIGYTRSKFGSECNAAYNRIHNGSY